MGPGQKSWWRTVAVNQKTNCVESNLKLGPDQPTKPTTFARWKGFLQSDTYRRWYIWSIYPITKRHCALSLVTDPLVQKFLYSEVSEAPSCIWSSKDCDRGKWRLKQRVPWVRKQLIHWRYFKGFLLSPSYNFRDKLLSQRPLQTACHYYKPVIFSLTSNVSRMEFGFQESDHICGFWWMTPSDTL